MQSVPFETSRKQLRMTRWIVGVSCLNLALLCVLSYLLHVVSETWWVSAILTYAPRLPYLFPTVMLVLISLLWHRESLGINLISAMIVLVPVMGLSLPLDKWMNGSAPIEGETPLKILSCNVQAFRPDFDKVLAEIAAINPDIIAFQEAFRGDDRLEQNFPNWHTLRHGHYWVGSRFPIAFISDCEVTQFGGRLAGMIVSVETPGGTIVFADIHQMTARHGITRLNRKTVLSGEGKTRLENFEGERLTEAIDIRAAVDVARQDRPLIVCGDFNTPTSSTLFQKQWGDLQSAFDLVGFGYGYTSPCKGNQYWPHNTPWVRIDHILCSEEWTVKQCQIGQSDGSDHRLIAATIALKPSRQ